MKLCPSNVNLIQRIPDQIFSSLQYWSSWDLSTGFTLNSTICLLHFGSVSFIPFVKLWKLWVLMYLWNWALSWVSSSLNSSSVWGFLFLISYSDWKTKLGRRYWYRRYFASCLISNLLVTFLIAYSLISFGRVLFNSISILLKSMFSLSSNLLRGLSVELLIYLGDISSFRLIALQRACTFLSVLAARDHFTLLGSDMLVSRMNPLSKRACWMTFSMVLTSGAFCHWRPLQFSPLYPKKIATLSLKDFQMIGIIELLQNYNRVKNTA